jgi:hypothetical protein
LVGCRRKVYVLDPAPKYRIAYATDIPVIFTDPDTGKKVIYTATFPANSFVVFPDSYLPGE